MGPDRTTKTIAYVAGPYIAGTPNGIHRNIEAARSVAVVLWRLGFPTITPHMNTAHMGGILPETGFVAGYLEILARCDLVVLLPGWEESLGAKAEHAAALRAGKDVLYLTSTVPDAVEAALLGHITPVEARAR